MFYRSEMNNKTPRLSDCRNVAREFRSYWKQKADYYRYLCRYMKVDRILLPIAHVYMILTTSRLLLMIYNAVSSY